jgi:uncharacterized membrane protein AbrB (regulator of aidB expression)
MTLISDSMGVNSQVVAIMQLVRLLRMVVILPILIKILLKLGC